MNCAVCNEKEVTTNDIAVVRRKDNTVVLVCSQECKKKIDEVTPEEAQENLRMMFEKFNGDEIILGEPPKKAREFWLNEVELKRVQQFEELHKNCVYHRAARKFYGMPEMHEDLETNTIPLERDSTDLRELQKTHLHGSHYIFYPTGIGEAIEYVCGCGQRIDVTDGSDW